MSHEIGQTVPGAVMQLPTLVISPTDVARLQRELESLEDFLEQAHIRDPDSPAKMPRTSSLFEEFGTINKLDWLLKQERLKAASYLATIKNKAPVFHISFAADPSAAFMAKLVTWLRHNIHPQLLVRVGLQPTIAAGCVLRTQNHSYDFSLRHHLIGSRPILIESLRKSIAGPS